MLLVPSAGSEQQYVILCFEIFDESSAFCRDEADVFLFRAGHEIHAFILKPGIFLWDALKTIDRPTVAAEQGTHNRCDADNPDPLVRSLPCSVLDLRHRQTVLLLSRRGGRRKPPAGANSRSP